MACSPNRRADGCVRADPDVRTLRPGGPDAFRYTGRPSVHRARFAGGLGHGGLQDITARGRFSSVFAVAALAGYTLLFFILAAWRFQRVSE